MERPVAPNLSTVHEHLLDALLKDSGVSISEVEDLRNLMLSPNKTKGKMLETLSVLDGFSVNPETAKNPRVKEGYKTLKKIIDRNTTALKLAGASLVVRGSLRYDDPNHMDLDCGIFTLKDDYFVKMRMSVLSDQMVENWQRYDKNTERPILVTFETLNKHIEAIENSDNHYIDVLSEDIYVDFSIFASSILNGYTIFSPVTNREQFLKTKVLEMCDRSPFVLACVCMGLEKCLEIRLKRRGLK